MSQLFLAGRLRRIGLFGLVVGPVLLVLALVAC